MSYPPSYPPQMPPPAPYPPMGYHPPRPSRSGIPRVVGILAIVFSCIGLLISLAASIGPKGDIEDFRQFGFMFEDGGFTTWLDIFLVLSLAVFALHLAGGIAACAYKRSAQPLLTVYAIAAIVLAVADVIIPMMTVNASPEVYEELVVPRIGLSALALPWPIVALILINLRASKQACGR